RINYQRTQPKGFTLEEQESQIRHFAAARNLTLKRIIQDEAETSATLDLSGLAEVLQLAESGEITTLIVPRLDRLVRVLHLHQQVLQKLCHESGVNLISIEENVETATACGQRILNIIGILSKWESRRISDRTRELIERKRRIGERVGHAPYGFVYQNKKLIPAEEEVEIVKLIRQKREMEQLSYSKIAKYLNQNLIPAKRGGNWYTETVKTVCTNPVYGEPIRIRGRMRRPD
ncbi:MAG: recombinase family protein, partial [bacterium]